MSTGHTPEALPKGLELITAGRYPEIVANLKLTVDSILDSRWSVDFGMNRVEQACAVLEQISDPQLDSYLAGKLSAYFVHDDTPMRERGPQLMLYMPIAVSLARRYPKQAATTGNNPGPVIISDEMQQAVSASLGVYYDFWKGMRDNDLNEKEFFWRGAQTQLLSGLFLARDWLADDEAATIGGTVQKLALEPLPNRFGVDQIEARNTAAIRRAYVQAFPEETAARLRADLEGMVPIDTTAKSATRIALEQSEILQQPGNERYFLDLLLAGDLRDIPAMRQLWEFAADNIDRFSIRVVLEYIEPYATDGSLPPEFITELTDSIYRHYAGQGVDTSGVDQGYATLLQLRSTPVPAEQLPQIKQLLQAGIARYQMPKFPPDYLLNMVLAYEQLGFQYDAHTELETAERDIKQMAAATFDPVTAGTVVSSRAEYVKFAVKLALARHDVPTLERFCGEILDSRGLSVTTLVNGQDALADEIIAAMMPGAGMTDRGRSDTTPEDLEITLGKLLDIRSQAITPAKPDTAPLLDFADPDYYVTLYRLKSEGMGVQFETAAFMAYHASLGSFAEPRQAYENFLAQVAETRRAFGNMIESGHLTMIQHMLRCMLFFYGKSDSVSPEQYGQVLDFALEQIARYGTGSSDNQQAEEVKVEERAELGSLSSLPEQPPKILGADARDLATIVLDILKFARTAENFTQIKDFVRNWVHPNTGYHN